MKALKNIYLSLGGNSKSTFEDLQKALNLLYARVGFMVAVSPVYKTAAWGFEGPDFLNCAVAIKTRLSSIKVLETILKIEQDLGRERISKSDKTVYHSRNIDIDLLFYEDEVRQSSKLTLPHPQLHNRIFVLKPLSEIAAHFVHPQMDKTILELLKETSDEGDCILYAETLINPRDQHNFQDYQYISIEGNIGAGKTTLATMIAEEFNAKIILERFKENPFLPKFYKDQARYAFPLEMSFLADRYQQLLDDIGQFDLFKNFMIADYDSHKSLIFAQITLNSDEFALYKKLHGMMYRELAKPGLYVYLYQNTERLLENIKNRGRAYEQEISGEYLAKINKGYMEFIKSRPRERVKMIDISSLDFVKNRSDYLTILDAMKP